MENGHSDNGSNDGTGPPGEVEPMEVTEHKKEEIQVQTFYETHTGILEANLSVNKFVSIAC
jgi:hypothetical protein